MKNLLVLKRTLIIFFSVITAFSYAQLADGFDIKAAYQQAKDKGVDEKIIDEYVKHKHTLFLRSQSETHSHKNSKKEPFFSQKILLLISLISQTHLKMLIALMPALKDIILQIG